MSESGQFYEDIEKFNAIYKLPSNNTPSLLGIDRIKNFQSILAEEVDEAAEIVEKYQALTEKDGGELSKASL